jgi:RNA polymerase sigma-B factor
MPRDLQELSLQIEDAWTELAAAGGHVPTVRELAVRLGTDDETVLAALEAGAAQHADALASEGEDPAGDHHDFTHTYAGDDPGYELADKRELLAGLLATLEPRERRVVYLRFHLELTQSEIGHCVGLSQMSVSRILRSSLERLREAADARSTTA